MSMSCNLSSSLCLVPVLIRFLLHEAMVDLGASSAEGPRQAGGEDGERRHPLLAGASQLRVDPQAFSNLILS